MTPKRKLVLVGAGGHAHVVFDLLERHGAYDVVGAVDPDPGASSRLGLKHLGSDDALPGLLGKGVRLAALGLGVARDTAPRRRMRLHLQALGFELPALVHPAAVVSRSVELSSGCQVMAGAVVNPYAFIGQGVIVNTGAVVEHECRLSHDSFIGPAAALGGAVVVEEGAFLGIGAVVLPGLRIGARAVVGAGAVVLENVPGGRTVAGVPAARIRP